MDCPVDGTTLLMTEREGVEIDYCPACRGVWLDRGELDKIIDRAGYDQPARAGRERAYPQPPPYQPLHDKKHKRKNLLGELFDF